MKEQVSFNYETAVFTTLPAVKIILVNNNNFPPIACNGDEYIRLGLAWFVCLFPDQGYS